MKKILVLSSTGGASHLAATRALEAILSDQYQLVSIYPLDKWQLFPRVSLEDTYNCLLRHRFTRSLNALGRIAAKTPIMRTLNPYFRHIIRRAIDKEQPDLVLVIVPLLIEVAVAAAAPAKLPVLLVTLDTDLSNWVVGLKRVRYPHLKVTASWQLPTTIEMLRQHNLPSEQIECAGFPIHPSFLHTDKEPHARPTILITMGGVGTMQTLIYVKELQKLPFDVDLIALCGRNEALREKLERFPNVTSLGYTQEVAKWMSKADLLITKPGPGIINEGLAMRLPMLLDATTGSLDWERPNLALVEGLGIGARVETLDQLPTLVSSFLDPKRQTDVEGRYTEITPNHFCETIGPIIDELIASSHLL